MYAENTWAQDRNKSSWKRASITTFPGSASKEGRAATKNAGAKGGGELKPALKREKSLSRRRTLGGALKKDEWTAAGPQHVTALDGGESNHQGRQRILPEWMIRGENVRTHGKRRRSKKLKGQKRGKTGGGNLSQGKGDSERGKGLKPHFINKKPTGGTEMGRTMGEHRYKRNPKVGETRPKDQAPPPTDSEKQSEENWGDQVEGEDAKETESLSEIKDSVACLIRRTFVGNKSMKVQRDRDRFAP